MAKHKSTIRQIQRWSLQNQCASVKERIRRPKSHTVHSGPLCKGFRTSDPQRNVMGQSTERSPLVSMLFQTFLNPLKFLMEIFNILVQYIATHTRAYM